MKRTDLQVLDVLRGCGEPVLIDAESAGLVVLGVGLRDIPLAGG
jgi:hypothetical protein